MKRRMISILMASVLLLTGCAGAGNETIVTEPLSGNMQMGNPFADCTDIDQAQELAGFAMELPQSIPQGYGVPVYRVMNDYMLEVIYPNETDEIRIRKAKAQEDISGDYTVYEQNTTVSIDGVNAELSGNDGLISLARWTQGEFSYSINISTGMEQSAMEVLVVQVK